MRKSIVYKEVFILLVAAIAFTLPFSIQANSLLISALIIFFLILIPWFNWRKIKLQNFALPGLYLLFLLGMIYTENIKEGLFQLEVKLTLLIFPIIFGAFRTKFHFNSRSIFNIFYLAVLSSAVICILFASIQNFKSGNSNSFFRENLAAILKFHPIYYSLYIGIALLLKIEDVRRNIMNWSFYKAFLTITSLIFLFFFNILLAAKMPIIALIAVLIFYLNFNLKTWIHKFVFTTIIILSFVTTIYFLPFVKEQFNSIIHSKLYFDYKENNANSLTLRLVKWKCSIEGIKTSPIFGLGTGDAKDYLQECYVENNFWGSVFQYNSHNEYLSTGLRIGLVGLLYFVIIMLYFLLIFYKRKIYFCILIFFLLCFLTESMFSIQKGIVLFTFIVSIFYFDQTIPRNQIL